ncbi:MAG TPA: type II secretion system protein [Candidatus Paceibacterota bacterium]
MTLKNNSQRAFTLIELLVVIAIIGILTTVVITFTKPARDKARDARRKTELKSLVTSIETFYLDNGYYPLHYGDPDTGSCPAAGKCSACTGWCRDGTPSKDPGGASWNMLKSELLPYAKVLPDGPTPAYWMGYVYTTSVRINPIGDIWTNQNETTPQRYCVGTYLKDPNDISINNPTANPEGTILSSCNKFMWGCGANYFICDRPPDLP